MEIKLPPDFKMFLRSLDSNSKVINHYGDEVLKVFRSDAIDLTSLPGSGFTWPDVARLAPIGGVLSRPMDFYAEKDPKLLMWYDQAVTRAVGD